MSVARFCNHNHMEQYHDSTTCRPIGIRYLVLLIPTLRFYSQFGADNWHMHTERHLRSLGRALVHKFTVGSRRRHLKSIRSKAVSVHVRGITSKYVSLIETTAIVAQRALPETNALECFNTLLPMTILYSLVLSTRNNVFLLVSLRCTFKSVAYGRTPLSIRIQINFLNCQSRCQLLFRVAI